MAKHTPGPWQIDGPNLRMMSFAILAPSARQPGMRTVIAHVEQQNDRLTGDEQDQANARLISCAPDMLNLLKALYSGVKQTERPGNLILHADEIQAIADAIAKAEGND